MLVENLVSAKTDEGEVLVEMTLGKGVYATTALANVVNLEQGRGASALATDRTRGHLGTHHPEEGAEGPEESEPE